MTAGQESLATLLLRERTLEQSIVDLKQMKGRLSHDLDAINRGGTARIIIISSMVPIKAIVNAFEGNAVPETLKKIKELTEMLANIYDRTTEIKQGQLRTAIIRQFLNDIKENFV